MPLRPNHAPHPVPPPRAAVHNVQSATAAALSVFPDPVRAGMCTVSLSANTEEQVQLLITDVSGRIVQKAYSVTNRPLNIELPVPAGVYFLSATTVNGKWHAKIIVE